MSEIIVDVRELVLRMPSAVLVEYPSESRAIVRDACEKEFQVVITRELAEDIGRELAKTPDETLGALNALAVSQAELTEVRKDLYIESLQLERVRKDAWQAYVAAEAAREVLAQVEGAEAKEAEAALAVLLPRLATIALSDGDPT